MGFKGGEKILIKYTKEKAFSFEKGEFLIIFLFTSNMEN